MITSPELRPVPPKFWIKWLQFSIFAWPGALLFAVFGAMVGASIAALFAPPPPENMGDFYIPVEVFYSLRGAGLGGWLTFMAFLNWFQSLYLQAYTHYAKAWMLIGLLGGGVVPGALMLIFWLITREISFLSGVALVLTLVLYGFRIRLVGDTDGRLATIAAFECILAAITVLLPLSLMAIRWNI